MADDKYSRALIELREEVQRLKDTYGRIHAKEHEYQGHAEGVVHGQWLAFMTVEKLIQKAFEKTDPDQS